MIFAALAVPALIGAYGMARKLINDNQGREEKYRLAKELDSNPFIPEDIYKHYNGTAASEDQIVTDALGRRFVVSEKSQLALMGKTLEQPKAQGEARNPLWLAAGAAGLALAGPAGWFIGASCLERYANSGKRPDAQVTVSKPIPSIEDVLNGNVKKETPLQSAKTALDGITKKISHFFKPVKKDSSVIEVPKNVEQGIGTSVKYGAAAAFAFTFLPPGINIVAALTIGICGAVEAKNAQERTHSATELAFAAQRPVGTLKNSTGATFAL